MKVGLGGIVRSGLYLYLSSLVNNVSGFLYWTVILAIGGSEILGYTSAVVGLASLITGILSFGIDIGVRRFLGETLGLGRIGDLRVYFWTTVYFLLAVYCTASIVVYVLGSIGLVFGEYKPEMLKLASVMVLLGIAAPFTSLIVTYLKTEFILLASIIGNTVKFALGVNLVLLGFDWVGATVGYTMVSIVHLAIGLTYTLKSIGFTYRFNIDYLTKVLKAGIASWTPGVIVLVGQWLSVLTVFGCSGAYETGQYYIAFTISGLILMVSSSMNGLLLPVLSGMSYGRERLCLRVLKLGLAVTVPLALILVAYPWLPSILLREFNAEHVLRVLALSTIPLALTGPITNLVYAYGDYTQVLKIGLAQNIPRIILYTTITPLLGALGSAIAYLTGSITGLLQASHTARKIGFTIDWWSIVKTVVTPLAIVLFLTLTPWIPWPIGVATIIAVSTIVNVKTKLISRSDVREIVESILPETIAKKIIMGNNSKN